ncbi:MAG TPA: radical SAM protein [Dehalococcoidia bacterium]|nr:radical SAM protein [Dehalococcoidia bacterium]
MTAPVAVTPARRLWIYTNFDCNLQCSYCVARSSPRAERRVLAPHVYRRLIDEAVLTGVREVLLTGGEPFLLPDIAERLNYAADRLPTTVLSNAMLYHGRRLESLQQISREVTVQVSLDGGEAATHDDYRGAGSWQKTVAGIRTLRELGFTVVIGSTETPANRDCLDDLRAFVTALGIPRERHFLRPLAKRGFSREGLELSAADLEPELTVSQDGVFWHPLALDEDMLLTRRIFPLAAAWELLACRWQQVLAAGALPRPFK